MPEWVVNCPRFIAAVLEEWDSRVRDRKAGSNPAKVLSTFKSTATKITRALTTYGPDRKHRRTLTDLDFTTTPGDTLETKEYCWPPHCSTGIPKQGGGRQHSTRRSWHLCLLTIIYSWAGSRSISTFCMISGGEKHKPTQLELMSKYAVRKSCMAWFGPWFSKNHRLFWWYLETAGLPTWIIFISSPEIFVCPWKVKNSWANFVEPSGSVCLDTTFCRHWICERREHWWWNSGRVRSTFSDAGAQTIDERTTYWSQMYTVQGTFHTSATGRPLAWSHLDHGCLSLQYACDVCNSLATARNFWRTVSIPPPVQKADMCEMRHLPLAYESHTMHSKRDCTTHD